MTEQLLTDIRFASLDLEPALLRGVEAAGYEYCTPIQAAALPIALEGKDVQGQAQTGTGKTAAFLLAAMNRLLRESPGKGHRSGDPRVVVLAPTRELAVQIHKDALIFAKYVDLRIGVVFGGTGYDTQRRMLEEGTDILIGTPGRLIDYYKQHIYGLGGVQVVVIDEADRMFDLGFIRDIRYFLRRMPAPERRQSMLFSATLSFRVAELAYEHMNLAELIDATPAQQVTVSNVSQCLYHVSKEEKIPLLLGLLKSMDATRTIVFVNTKRVGEIVTGYLAGNGYACGVLSGDVPQRKRLGLLERFSRGEVPILVATDVAARGLHIPDVSHVINFDLPQDAEDYVHRVGRTARAGASGDAVSFACEEYVFSLSEIEDFIGQKLPVEPVSDQDLVVPKPAQRQARGRRTDDKRQKRGGRGQRVRQKTIQKTKDRGPRAVRDRGRKTDDSAARPTD